jgi:Sec-independent protein secretion pathway component TatC
MWLLSRIGVMEVIFLFLAIVLACCLGRRGLRWLAAIGPLLVLGMLISGPDLLSMLLAVILLMLPFSLGIYWGPRLISPARRNATRNGGVA